MVEFGNVNTNVTAIHSYIVVKAIGENQKSTVSECIEPRYQIKRKEMWCLSFYKHHTREYGIKKCNIFSNRGVIFSN